MPPALEAAGSHSAAEHVGEAARALDPFQSLSIADFAAFLARAKEYQASGVVRVPAAAEQQAETLLKLVAQLIDAAKSPSPGGLAAIQQEVAGAIQSLAAATGLKGKLAPDPKWAAEQVARSRVARQVQATYELAARIISPDVYNDASVRESIARVESGLDADSLKTFAAEFGVKASAKSQPGKVIHDVLVKLTGHKPAKVKAKSAIVDETVVEEHVQRLGKLIERSVDPDAVSESEIEAELGRLTVLPKETLHAVIARAAIEGARPSDSKSAMLQRVRNRLTAARRARERAAV